MPTGAMIPGGALAPRPPVASPTTLTNPLAPQPPIALVPPAPPPATAAQPQSGGPEIIDATKEAGFGNRFGTFAKPPIGMVIHHTGGGRTVGQVISTYQKRGYPAQFVIDRDGKIYQTLPDGAQGRQIIPGTGPVGEGKSNANTEGVEVIADNDQDVTPAQAQAAARLVMSRAQKWGYDPQTSVWGHGEVNPGHKQAEEGRTITAGIRDGSLLRQIGVPENQINAPPQIEEPTPETARAYSSNAIQSTRQMSYQRVPTAGAPEVNPAVQNPTTATPTGSQLSWVPAAYRQPLIDAANAEGVDPNLLAAVVQHESGFNPTLVGRAGEIGLGQLMPDTARSLGVDPTDPNQNLIGAARYLHQQLVSPRSGGDVGRALQMYNGGPGTNFQNTAYPAQVFSDYKDAAGSPYTGTGLPTVAPPAGAPPATAAAPPRYVPTPTGSGYSSGLPTAPAVAPVTDGGLGAPSAAPGYAATPPGSGYGSGLSADPNANLTRFAEPPGYTDYNPLWGHALDPGTMRVGGAVGNVVNNQQQSDTQPGGVSYLPTPATSAADQSAAGGPGGPPADMTGSQMLKMLLATGFRGVQVNYDPWESLKRFPQNTGRPSSYLGGLTPVSDPRIPVPGVSYSPVSNPFFSVIRQPGRSGSGAEIAAQQASYGGE